MDRLNYLSDLVFGPSPLPEGGRCLQGLCRLACPCAAGARGRRRAPGSRGRRTWRARG